MDQTEIYLKELLIDLKKSPAVVFTGAGVSTNSGIPDFRGSEGFYKTHHEEELAVNALFKNPEKFYTAFQKRFTSVFHAKPNKTHEILADLEALGYIKGIITQNVDRLHQKGGSKHVIEFHGNIFFYDLIKLNRRNNSYRFLKEDVPYTEIANKDIINYKIDDQTFYKPQVVLFGEGISSWSESVELAKTSDLHIIMGTSYQVYPFNMVSYENPQAKVYVINNEPIEYNGRCKQIIGDSSDLLIKLIKMLKSDN